MSLNNEAVEQAIANLKSAQTAISDLFNTKLGNQSVFDHTGYTWGESGDSVFLTLGENEWDDEIHVKYEFHVGNYTLLYATEDVHNAKNNDKWNNMSFYIVSTDCGFNN